MPLSVWPLVPHHQLRLWFIWFLYLPKLAGCQLGWREGPYLRVMMWRMFLSPSLSLFGLCCSVRVSQYEPEDHCSLLITYSWHARQSPPSSPSSRVETFSSDWGHCNARFFFGLKYICVVFPWHKESSVTITEVETKYIYLSTVHYFHFCDDFLLLIHYI